VALTPTQWGRIQEVFHVLADRAPEEQSEELARLATGEPDVAEQVRGMLVADAAGASVLDRGVTSAAADLLRSASSLPPQRFGAYRLERLLGEGGMGVVYLAHRDDLDARAAIKVLANAWLSPARRERFRLEMQTLAGLSHPSIARLLDADHLPDGTPWFAMEYVEGAPITTWAWQRALTIRQVLELFIKVCDAVQHAHERAVIHRDIKPSNILVTEDGSVKLLDFGIAKRFRESPGEARTRTTFRMLTPEYAAPEQLSGSVVGVSADVYSLAIVLYELLEGVRPYEVPESGDVEEVIRRSHPPRLRRTERDRGTSSREGSPATPPAHAETMSSTEWADLNALLANALATDASERYRSVEAFRADVERFLRHEPLSARTATWRYRTRKFVRRRWREAGVAGLLVVAAATALALHTRTLTAARDVALAEAARTTRMQHFLVSLFQGGPQGLVPGDSLQLSTVVQNGIREAAALGDPVTQSELVGTLGIVSEQMGNFARADSLFRDASARAARVYGATHPESYRARVRGAAIRTRLGQGDSAELQLRAIRTEAALHVPPDHPVRQEIDETLGKLLAEGGKPVEAIPLLQEAVRQRERADSRSREYAESLRELGNALTYAGNLPAADSAWRRALPVMEHLQGAGHPNVGFLLTNLGTIASMRGDLAVAERDLRDAAAISAGWYGPHHWLTAGARFPLGQTLIRQKKFGEAATLLREVIADYATQPLVASGPATALAYNALGHALLGEGDLAGAREAFTLASSRLHAVLGPRHMNTLLNDVSLANLLVDEGRLDQAISTFRDAIGRARAAYGDGHPEVAGFGLRFGRALVRAGRAREAADVIAAGLRVLDSAKAGNPDDVRRSLESLESAYTQLGDTARAREVRARRDRMPAAK